MSHATLVEVYSAVCPWLALVWCLQRAARLLKHPLRGWMLLAATGAIAAVVMVVPAQGLVIARWVAGLNANFSIPLTVMLALIVWERDRSIDHAFRNESGPQPGASARLAVSCSIRWRSGWAASIRTNGDGPSARCFSSSGC